MSSTSAETSKKLTKKDFDSGIDVRWCPGCGDYSVLANVQRVLPSFGVPREKIIFVSGIGCSSRFPYYMNTYGMHSIHGRAPAIATGLKSFRPDLQVWVVTGDGDALSIGGNHIIHALRRNIDLNVMLFNNQIYGLTKGQYSPTSAPGKVTKSSPAGSIDRPFEPASLALGAEATFVARCVDTDAKETRKVLTAAQEHRGTSFVEIYQNCLVFNDDAFVSFTDRKVRADEQLILAHGEPMIFGKDSDKGIALKGGRPSVVKIGEDGITESDLIVHDMHDPDPSMAFWLSRFQSPVVLGVFRSVKAPTYDAELHAQVAVAKEKKGEGSLEDLLQGGVTWTVD